MIDAAFNLLSATVALGMGLSCFYLVGRRIGGWARLASWAHGLGGALGAALVVWAVRRGVPGPAGFGDIAAVMLVLTLAGGLIIAFAQLRRRKPPGLVVAVHATFGVAGLVILAALVWR